MKLDDNSFWILFWVLCVVLLSIFYYFDYKTEELKQQTKIKIEQMNVEDRQNLRDTLDKYKEDIKNLVK